MPCLFQLCAHRPGVASEDSIGSRSLICGDLTASGCDERMRRSSSFPGADLDEIASDRLANRLTAQLTGPAVPSGSGPDSSASSGDLDSDTFAEDWAVADDASTPTRYVSVYGPQQQVIHSWGHRANSRSTLQITHSVMNCIAFLIYGIHGL